MRNVELGSLGEFKNGINFKSERMGSGIHLINVKDITNAPWLDEKGLDLVDVDISENEFAQENDIFFVRSSVKLDGIGLVSKFRSIQKNAIHCGFVIRFRPTSEDLDSTYLLYLLRSPYYREKLKGLSSGAAIINISQTVLKRLKVPIPDVNTQKRIAEIIKNYDDLIENNVRRVELLEKSAQLLYKEWFVRYKFPGCEHTKFKNEIPEGWERKKIEDVCESIGGGTPSTKKSEYWENGDIIWLTPTDVTKNNCLILTDSEKKITDIGLKNSSAKLIPPDTILMTSRATIGYFALIDKTVCTNQGFISVITNEDYYRMYILFNLISRKEEMISYANGTTYKEIIKSTFRKMEIILPNEKILQLFNDTTYPLLKQVRILKKQIDKLERARELLLPKLLNGEISV